MTFNKTGRLIRRNFFINGALLESVRSYKYLGFLLTPSVEIRSGLYDLRDRALKAFMKLKSDLGYAFKQDILTTLHLTDSLISPILLYMSDFWGCLKMPKSNPIENIKMMICKQILGVQKQTTNIGVLLELGETPLSLNAIKLAVKNWERIRLGNANKVLLASYRESLEGSLTWISGIKNVLETNGMLCFFQNSYRNTPIAYKNLFQRLIDQFHQNAFETIRKEDSKLRTYALFKKNIGIESYLVEIRNPETRSAITKFRLSNHCLMIETGRYTNIPKESRFCPFCENLPETESHFLIDCPTYKPLRDRLLKRTMQNVQYYTADQKMESLLTNIDLNTIEYIVNAFKLRIFLLQKYKRGW